MTVSTTRSRSPRRILRVAVVSAVAVPVLGATAPALAAAPGWRGSGITLLEVLGLYVGIPVATFIGIALLFVLIPSWSSEARHRPDLTWTAEPAWFAGPRDGQQSVEVAEPSQDGGGASASW